MLKNLSKDKLHHTNICIGDRGLIIQDLDSLISNYRKDIKNIERLVYEYDKFHIDDARHIFSIHLHKTGADEMQIICIAFNSTNTESQNSILKMLEEPRANTYFFIIVPSKKIILPTVLSRAHVFEYVKDVTVSSDTEKFIKFPLAKRLEFVKTIIEDIKNEKKNKQNVIEFIEELEKYVYEKKDMKLAKRIIEIKEYLKDQGASVKQLLEYLAVQI